MISSARFKAGSHTVDGEDGMVNEEKDMDLNFLCDKK